MLSAVPHLRTRLSMHRLCMMILTAMLPWLMSRLTMLTTDMSRSAWLLRFRMLRLRFCMYRIETGVLGRTLLSSAKLYGKGKVAGGAPVRWFITLLLHVLTTFSGCRMSCQSHVNFCAARSATTRLL